MRRIIAFAACLIMVVSMFSCGAKNAGKESVENSQEYAVLIELYKKAVTACAWYDGGETGPYADEYGAKDPEQKALFEELLYHAFLNYPGRGEEDQAALAHRLSYGYAIKDLNRDGIDELVFLQEDYTVIAVLSMSDGKPVLLGSYRPRRTAWIDGDGLIHLCGSNGADKHVDAVYKIPEGSSELELIVEYGTLGKQWVDDVAVQTYYKLENDLAMDITAKEYDALVTRWHYLGNSGTAVTKEHSGLQYVPLFDQLIDQEQAIAIAKDYWKDYNIEKYRYRVMLGANDKAPDSVYVIIIRRLVNLGQESHESTFDEIWVDKAIGKPIIPTWNDEKG